MPKDPRAPLVLPMGDGAHLAHRSLLEGRVSSWHAPLRTCRRTPLLQAAGRHWKTDTTQSRGRRPCWWSHLGSSHQIGWGKTLLIGSPCANLDWGDEHIDQRCLVSSSLLPSSPCFPGHLGRAGTSGHQRTRHLGTEAPAVAPCPPSPPPVIGGRAGCQLYAGNCLPPWLIRGLTCCLLVVTLRRGSAWGRKRRSGGGVVCRCASPPLPKTHPYGSRLSRPTAGWVSA